METLVEGDLKALFSIATILRCREGCYSIPLLRFILDPQLVMLSVKQGGIKYHFLSLWYDWNWDWTPVSRTIGEHSTPMCLPMVQQTRVQSQVKSYQRLKKWYLMPPCLTLSIIKYVSRVKEQSRKWKSPSPIFRCSSYWKGSLQVTLDYCRQLYLFLSDTNNLYTTVWFQVFLYNTNKYMVSSNYFYLIIVFCLHTVKWFQVINNNNNP